MSKISRIIIGAVVGASAVYGLEVQKGRKFKKEVEKEIEICGEVKMLNDEDRANFMSDIDEDMRTGFWKQFEGRPTAYLISKLNAREEI